MKYRDNWAKSQARFEAFWNREILDRCLISITTRNASKEITTAVDKTHQWTDAEYIIKRNRAAMERTYYGGEAFPQIILNLGASGHAGFFEGAKYQFEDSVWFFPSLDSVDALKFDENSHLFRKTIELAQAFVEDSRGDYFVSMPDCTGNADALSHLMGPDRLMEEMLDDPEPIETALEDIEQAYERAMREVYRITKDNNQGGSTVGWLGTWAPGFHAQMQCDMSVMISPSMFDRFIVPELTAQCKLLTYPLYHFDGIEQTRHLDTLLSIPNLRAIQWTQVEGQPPATDYIPTLRKIQEAGKNLVIIVSPGQIEPLMQALSSKGLYLTTVVDTPEEGEAVLRLVSRLTHD